MTQRRRSPAASRLTALCLNTIFPLSDATYIQTEHPLLNLSDLMLGQARVAQAFERVHLRLPIGSGLQRAAAGPAHNGCFRSCVRATAVGAIHEHHLHQP